MARKKWLTGVLLAIFLFSGSATAGSAEALEWLSSHQNADGSWGGADCWQPVCTPFAAIALLNASGNSSNVSAALAWMKADLQDAESWSWAEADIPGAELLAVAASGNYSDLNLSNVSARLLGMQDNESGGFKGWLTENGTIADSVDTALALMGLMAAESINESNASAAAAFLLSLQNPDGSFNHSGELAEASLSSLGPDLASTTALALLAMNASGANASDAEIQAALAYLKNEASACFGNQGRVYSASAASLAFKAFNESYYALAGAACVAGMQRQDGGFADSRRTANASNSLDTGIASLALQAVQLPSMELNESVFVNQTLQINVYADGMAQDARITVTAPDGSNYSLEVTGSNNSFHANYTPQETGIHLIRAEVAYQTFNYSLEGAFNASCAPEGSTRECQIGSCAGTQACTGGLWGACTKTDLCCGVSCDDGNSCTADSCNPADGTCSNVNACGASGNGGGGYYGGGGGGYYGTSTPSTPSPTPRPAATPSPTVVFKTVEDVQEKRPPKQTVSPTPSPPTPTSMPQLSKTTGLAVAGNDFSAGALAAAAVLITLAYYFTAKRMSA